MAWAPRAEALLRELFKGFNSGRICLDPLLPETSGDFCVADILI